MKKLAGVLVAAAVLVAGCSSKSDGPPTSGNDLTDAPQPTPTAPATETAEWDNGLTATIEAVTSESVQSSQYDERGHDTRVSITMRLSNDGPDTFTFNDPVHGPNGPRDTLYYGVNLYEAQGWANPGNGIESLPKQLAQGTSATYTGVWSMPAEGLQSLTFEFTPDHGNLPTFTFTGVEALIA